MVHSSPEHGDPGDDFENNPLMDECPRDLLGEWECKGTVAAIDLTADMVDAGCSMEDIEKAVDMITDLMENEGVHMFTCSNGVKVTIVVHEGKIDYSLEEPGED